MAEQPDDRQPPANKADIRETQIALAMTSTGIHKHPTAFINTRLPVLEVALNVEAMTSQLAPLLLPLSRDGSPPTVSYAKLLAYKQGNRGLIHYEIAGTRYGELCVVFGKLYPQIERAQRVCRIMQALRDDCFGHSTLLGVPSALGTLPDLSMLVYLPAEGQFLGDALADAQALQYMDMAGEWLGTLHIHPLPLDRHFRLSPELVNVQAWAVLVGHKYPELAEDALRISKHLHEHASEMQFETDSAIHKDFHYGHIVVDGGLKVIDFDELRLGDPNFDVAHFCANLHLLAYRINNSPFQFSSLQSAFLRAYARTTDWVPNARFVYFYAYTCLKIAKQLCSMRGLRPRPDGEEQRRQVQLMLEQGVGALPNATRQKLSSKFATMIMEEQARET
jgi:Phosphotransferase enzyme family